MYEHAGERDIFHERNRRKTSEAIKDILPNEDRLIARVDTKSMFVLPLA
jgi:hypothetical protein